MFEADAERTGPEEPDPQDAVENPLLLEPVAPRRGATVADVPGGTLAFSWRVDAGAVVAAYPRRRLRTDFCLGIAGESHGSFIMLALPSDANAVLVSLDEIRLKLGSRYRRPARVALRWSLTLALAAGGPLFRSRESDLVLVAAS
jgi:hypothetical protein